MVECPLTLTHQPSGQGSNLQSLSPKRDSAFGYFSPPKTEHEIPYHHLRFVRPIIR